MLNQKQNVNFRKKMLGQKRKKLVRNKIITSEKMWGQKRKVECPKKSRKMLTKNKILTQKTVRSEKRLKCIDVLSKYAFSLQTDKGSEFVNRTFQSFRRKKKVKSEKMLKKSLKRWMFKKKKSREKCLLRTKSYFKNLLGQKNG